jgi:hypothetical protein
MMSLSVVVNLSNVFHDGKQIPIKSQKLKNVHRNKVEPKYVIGNPEAFAKSREILGNIIIKNMKASGGMDIDWMVERKGNFIILEIKTFHDDRIRLPVGQIIAYQSLHSALNKNGRCYLFIIGVDETDFTNDDSFVWIFEMKEWRDQKIPHIKRSFEGIDLSKDGFIVERSFMHQITVRELRNLLESAWDEFGN